MVDSADPSTHHWGCAETNLTLCGEYKHLMEHWPTARAIFEGYDFVIVEPPEQCALCDIMLECFPYRCPAGGWCLCGAYEPPEHNLERVGTFAVGDRVPLANLVNRINERWPA